jgi:parallel beta-helix repeat protein
MGKEATLIIILSVILIISGCDTSDPQLSKRFGKSGGIQCGDYITEDTVLEHDILDCPGHGLRVAVSDITLDCNGHTISSNGDYGHYGIRLEGPAFRANIKNCVIENFYNGMYIRGYDWDEPGEWERNHTISNNIINGSKVGIDMVAVTRVTIKDNIIKNSEFKGIWAMPVFNTTIEGNLFDNDKKGIETGTRFYYNTITQNTFINNEHSGISFGSYIFTDNENPSSENLIDPEDCPGPDIPASKGNKIFNNTFIDNTVSSEISGCGLAEENDWNLSEWGNYWDDFNLNSGFPTQYEIRIPDNIDYSPLCEGLILNEQCSGQKPLYCSQGMLDDNCQECGCPSGKRCLSSGSCIRIQGTKDIPEQAGGDLPPL